ncbi:MAG: ribonuclease R [Acidobacteria bacterium]|nr:ribonuclease R [Acidobacteriota bacterium]
MLTRSQKDKTLRYIQSLKSTGFTFREVVRFLDLDSDDRRSLQLHLDEMESRGIIRRIKRGRYALPARENIVCGTLECHRDGYGFAIPDDRSRFREDIFIPARNMEGALHGDRVLVRIERKKIPARRGRAGRRAVPEKQRLEGVVVRILERKHPHIVGRFHSHPRYPYVVPLDARLFHDIRIPFQDGKGAAEGQIVAVDITLPPGRNQIPQGKVSSVLGNPGDPGIEYEIVKHKYGLPAVFSPEAVRESDALPDRVLKKEHAGREDFRGETAVTIDGETARDFDDAVSLKRLPSGHYLLGVHIADVSHYVSSDSALDMDAYARGTSVYFPDRAIPMLPPKLSSGICSLLPDADRLVLSALMEINGKGKIVRSRFTKGIVRSRERMTYKSLAAILLDGGDEEKKRYADLVPLFQTMRELCEILSEKRYRRGAVDFELPEADIRLDESGKVVEIKAAERTIAHRIIEEFMLLANECAAETLHSAGGPALYRIHEKPDGEKVDEFADMAASLGYRLEKYKGRYRPKDFQVFVRRMEGKPEQKYLVYMMLRAFMQARYSEENVGHFALATPAYTHFTSPIRRYPDLVVHRLLKAAIDPKSRGTPEDGMTGRLPEIAAHASSRERIAEEAEREIEKIKKAQFMADKIGREFRGFVISANRQGLLVELREHYVEGFVPLTGLTDDRYRYNERSRSFAGSRRQKRFQPGSGMRVRLDAVDGESGRLIFSAVGGQSE